MPKTAVHLESQAAKLPGSTSALPYRRSRRHSLAWWLVIGLSWVIVLYGAAYLILRSRIFPPDLAASFRARPWGIYPHIIVGMIALAIGPLQFHPRVQARTTLHHTLGKIYIVIAMLVGIVGLYMAIYSFGGMVTHVGFGLLAVGVLIATGMAYRSVLRRRYARHREWMIRSYALMFAAPTLRLWMPLLTIANGGEFRPAYLWVSWLCWVPNLLLAEWYIRYTRRQPLRFAGSQIEETVAA
jgi:uncharacterized membrane protein